MNNDGKISFEEYDIFVRMVYETEYLPVLEKELKRRNLQKRHSSITGVYHFTPKHTFAR